MQPSATTVPASVRAEIAPSGTLIAGINYGNPVIVQKDPAGVARALARSGNGDVTVPPPGR